MASNAARGRRLSVAAITGGRPANATESLESRMRRERTEHRLAHLPKRVAKRRQTQLTLVKPIRDGRVATSNEEAVAKDEVVVRVDFIRVRSQAARRLFLRGDERAYDESVAPRFYTLSVNDSPRRRMDFSDTAKQRLQAEYRGLRKIDRGVRSRRGELFDQLDQCKDLLRVLREELMVLLDKRASLARKRLELIGELGAWRGRDAQGNAALPSSLVERKVSGRVCMRELLQQLSQPKAYAGVLATSGHPAPALLESRNELRQRARDAKSWRARLYDDEFAGEYSSDSSDSDASAENVEGEGYPTEDDRALAGQLLVFWDALDRLEAAHAGEPIEASAPSRPGSVKTHVRPTLVANLDSVPESPVGRRPAVRFESESIHNQGPEKKYTGFETEPVRPTSKTGSRAERRRRRDEPEMFSDPVVVKTKASWFGKAPALAPAPCVPLPPKPGRASARSSIRLTTISYAQGNGVPAKLALAIAEELPELFEGKAALVQLCLSMAKKWGKKQVPLSAFAGAKTSLWAALNAFVPWLARCAFADDFLWELRHERTLKAEGRRSKAVLAQQKMERGKPNLELEAAEAKDEGKVLKRRERRARTVLARERRGATLIKDATDGQLREQPADEAFMNSAAVHGNDTRVRLDVLEPALRAHLKEASVLRTALRAEVACLTQFILGRAAIHAQKMWRGKLARGDTSNDGAKDKLRNFTERQAYMGAYASCVQLQGWGRIKVARRVARNVRWWRKYDCAVRIQSQQRRVLAVQVALDIIAGLERRALARAVLLAQTRIRGWRIRARHGARTRYLRHTAHIARREWAATCINAHCRGRLAKRARTRKSVESEVNQRLLRLAHRYLKEGDLWSFVEAVDADYRRYERDAVQMQRREDFDAATFVEKVLEKRDGDHVQAWRAFMDATSSKYIDEKRSEKTALIPGPRLRLLLSGLGSEVTPEQELKARNARLPIEAGMKREGLVAEAYGVGSDAGGTESPRKLGSPARSPGSPQRSPARSQAGSPARVPASPGRSPRKGANPYEGRFIEPRAASPPNAHTNKKPHASWAPAYKSRSIMGLVNAANRAAQGDAGDRRERLYRDHSTPAGLEALLDVPRGLDDALEPFIRAAALRAHVPEEFPEGTSSSEAFAVYKALPPSLIKSKHELDAHRRVPRWIAALRASGFNTVKSLCPPRKCRETILGLEAWVNRNEEPGRPDDLDLVDDADLALVLHARPLADACCELLIDLHQIATKREDDHALASQGLAQNETAEKWKAIEAGHFSPNDESDFEEAPSEVLDADDRADLEAAMEGRRATALDRALRRNPHELVMKAPTRPLHPDDIEPNPSPRGREVQQALNRATGAIALETSLEDNARSDLRRAGGVEAPAKLLLRRAAFLSGGEPLDTFADALFMAASPEEERALVSERHREAAESTGVLGHELERAGISLAKDLAAADLHAFGASPHLIRRIEVLLRFLAPDAQVGRPKGLPQASAQRDAVLRPRATGPHKVPDVRVRPVALPYDPRFQRGPFDAAGAGRLLPGWSAGRTLPVPVVRAPAAEAFRIKAQGGDVVDYDEPPKADWLFLGGPGALAPETYRRPHLKDVEQELLPLHLQPQEFVGHAHRSGKLHKRVLHRATNYFTGYRGYTKTPQLFRDENRQAYDDRTGDVEEPPGTLNDLSEELLRNSAFRAEAPTPETSTVKTPSVATPYGVIKAAEKRKPRRRPAPRRRRPRPVDPEAALRSLIDKVDAATLDKILAEKRPILPEVEEVVEETPDASKRGELWARIRSDADARQRGEPVR